MRGQQSVSSNGLLFGTRKSSSYKTSPIDALNLGPDQWLALAKAGENKFFERYVRLQGPEQITELVVDGAVSRYKSMVNTTHISEVTDNITVFGSFSGREKRVIASVPQTAFFGIVHENKPAESEYDFALTKGALLFGQAWSGLAMKITTAPPTPEGWLACQRGVYGISEQAVRTGAVAPLYDTSALESFDTFSKAMNEKISSLIL